MYSYVSSILTCIYVSYHCCSDLFIQQQLSSSCLARWLFISIEHNPKSRLCSNGRLSRKKKNKTSHANFFSFVLTLQYLLWKNPLSHVSFFHGDIYIFLSFFSYTSHKKTTTSTAFFYILTVVANRALSSVAVVVFAHWEVFFSVLRLIPICRVTVLNGFGMPVTIHSYRLLQLCGRNIVPKIIKKSSKVIKRKRPLFNCKIMWYI